MLTLFPAKKVITMNPSLPEAEAILVENDRIVEVGTVKHMKPWLDAKPHQVDDSFSNHVICPGFIDPHLHPSMAAVLLPMEFITAMKWKLPWGTVEPTTTAEQFDQKMHKLHTEKTPEDPLFIWGFHALWHGSMSKLRINSVSEDRPIIVWHRSFHELYMNDAALKMVGLSAEDIKSGAQIDYENGHFYETGLGLAIARLNPWILSPERFGEGLKRLKEVVHYGGHTTIGDMATGLFDFESEVAALNQILEGDDVPFRTRLVAHGSYVRSWGDTLEDSVQLAAGLVDRNTHRLLFGNHIKLFSDGAFFSQLAQMEAPGYIDGHHGEWLMPPELLENNVRAYWHAGFQIHVHCCGNLGIELTLDILEKMQFEKPRFNHGFTIEHFGFSTPEQIKRIKSLGAQVSANIYYLHELSDMYAKQGIGYERASQISRLGSCFNEGINTTLHSDFTMAPAEPLNHAWVGINRVNAAGEVMCAEEKITPIQALEAITINAAHVLGMASQTGSLRSGKLADFTVLEDCPLSCPSLEINDIPIVGTVFEGKSFPIK
mgnify:FL=1